MEIPRPEVPEWAANAGCPAPFPDEGFVEYVTRIGLDADQLLDGLTSVTIGFANYRLATALAKASPGAFSDYVDQRIDVMRRRYDYPTP